MNENVVKRLEEILEKLRTYVVLLLNVSEQFSYWGRNNTHRFQQGFGERSEEMTKIMGVLSDCLDIIADKLEDRADHIENLLGEGDPIEKSEMNDIFDIMDSSADSLHGVLIILKMASQSREGHADEQTVLTTIEKTISVCADEMRLTADSTSDFIDAIEW